MKCRHGDSILLDTPILVSLKSNVKSPQRNAIKQVAGHGASNGDASTNCPKFGQFRTNRQSNRLRVSSSITSCRFEVARREILFSIELRAVLTCIDQEVRRALKCPNLGQLRTLLSQFDKTYFRTTKVFCWRRMPVVCLGLRSAPQPESQVYRIVYIEVNDGTPTSVTRSSCLMKSISTTAT